MGVLQRFERRLGGLVEGAFARLFKGGVEPVEIASALARECDDKKAIGQHRTLVPNDFTVELGESDYAHLEPYAEAVAEELASLVREHATEQRYSFIGPVRVRFANNDDLNVGMFRVRSGVDAGAPAVRPRAPRARADAAPTPAPSGAPGTAVGLETGEDGAAWAELASPDPDRLEVRAGGDDQGGERLLEGEEVLIGRAAEADVRLTDSGVSRRHALLSRSGDTWWVEDLGSTNGTLVNGERVRRARLSDGDEIEVGASTLVYHAGGG